MNFLVIHGPNLNQLGKRDQALYGKTTLPQINSRIEAHAKELGVDVSCFQANSEGAIIDHIQQHSKGAAGIIINPGAYTHYSFAIHDALLDAATLVAEVHLSNIGAREEWRRRSVISPAARGSISGFGWRGYLSALDLLVALAKEKS